MNNALLFIGQHPVLLFLIAFVIIGITFFLGHEVGLIHAKLMDKNRIKAERKDAIKKSRAVMSGLMAEQIAPFLPNFPCNPGDVRFVGKPIDFVGFPGATDGKPIKEVLLIEVKTGKSMLSQREQQIRDAVSKGRVRYVEYRVDED